MAKKQKVIYPFRINQRVILNEKGIEQAESLLRNHWGKVGKGKGISSGGLAILEQSMAIVRNAYEIQVCGITPKYGQNMFHVANQCYLPGVAGAACPISHHHALLFRAKIPREDIEGMINQVAIIIDGFYNLSSCVQSR